MKIVTRAVAIKNLQQYIGKDLRSAAKEFKITTYETGRQNKGWKGQVLEKIAGLTNNSSKAPNGLTYELKSVSFRANNDVIVPKETMAITMINQDDLKNHTFLKSHCWEKLKTLVFCAVEWNGKNSQTAKLLNVTSLDFTEDDKLIKEIEADYNFIRAKFLKEGFEALTGKDGKWIQARTKGTGGINPRTGERRPITRAFYARKSLVKEIFENSK